MPSRLEQSLESVSRSSTVVRKRSSKTRVILKPVAAAILIFCAYWNVLTAYWKSEYLPTRESDEVVIRETRLAPIRENLLSMGYRGEIAFVTNHTLLGLPPTPEDDKRWGQSQYAMIPWILVRDKENAHFVMADFWDGPPAVPMEGFTKIYDDGHGLILFRAKHAS